MPTIAPALSRYNLKGYEYTIRAIPTEFDGIEYRSRLEARWGAFFTVLGWDFVYEPVDLVGWAPDFVIRGDGGDTLVEVKPEITADVVAAFRGVIPAASRSLIVGAGPVIGPDAAIIGMGWGEGVLEYDGPIDDDHPYPTRVGGLEKIAVGRCGAGRHGCGFGLNPVDGCFSCWRCGAYDGNSAHDPVVIDGLWKRSCNMTKWGR